jgi:serine protease SohB
MSEVLVFAAKALIIVLALGSLIVLITALKARAKSKTELQVEAYHENLKLIGDSLEASISDKEDWKRKKKEKKLAEKAEKKAKKERSEAPHVGKSKVFVLRFKGDLKASEVEPLREEVTAILQVAKPGDEAVAILESPGGVVHGYGLAASQLLRLREGDLQLTTCVDKVAASGGYLMACVAHKVIAAPFAIVGSIGVIAQVPNVHRLLKKYDVDYKEYTAGEFKRTVSLLGEITPKGEQKFQEQIENVHGLFKKFVHTYRPNIPLEEVSSGEYWYGEKAKSLNLIDAIQTSDDYLLQKFRAGHAIYEISAKKPSPWWDRFSENLAKFATQTGAKILRG